MNRGSPYSKRRVANLLELVWKIREGEIREFLWDEDNEVWARAPLIPYPPRPLDYVSFRRLSISPTSTSTIPSVPDNVQAMQVVIKSEYGNEPDIRVFLSGDEDNYFEMVPGEVLYLSTSDPSSINIKNPSDTLTVYVGVIILGINKPTSPPEEE